uniref:Large ribosomal subunit protein bL32c n=1 Tax=Yamadaella caenomyce TaxID=259029 RepID=A0A1G4NYJ0_9FLOR|nr:Ribosomal protein L32 [Yamadaella caenomyce]SCW23712.1 Ribosomal protein L32 [Yamadaella caenomyce]
MAVPKKRTSKAKTRQRKAQWKHKATIECSKALSLGKSVITGKNQSFIYVTDKSSQDQEDI